MMEKVRVAWVDWAKVICIWLMVCCHAGQKGLILSITYQFHMPAFFIISGMLFRPKGVWVTMKSFGVPILVFGFLNLIRRLLYGVYKGGEVNPDVIVSWIKGFLLPSSISVFQGYWFVLTLLLMRLLMEFDWMRKRKLLISCACLIWCSIEPHLNMPEIIMKYQPYHILSCLPFFAFGMIIKEKKIDMKQGSFEMKLIGAMLFFIVTLIQGRVDLGEYNYGLNYTLLFVNAIIGSWLLFNICSFAPAKNWLQNLSTGTFLILGMHGMIYPYISWGLRKFSCLINPYLPLFVGLIVIATCYPLIVWCKKKCPIVLGKTSV